MYKYEAKDVINPDENIKIYKYSPEPVQDEHIHGFIEIVYIASGKGQHVINNVSYDVERGDLLFFNFGQRHSFRHGGEMVIVNCLLNPSFLSDELIDSDNAFEILTLASFQEFGGSIEDIIPKISFRGIDMLDVETIIELMLKEFREKCIGYKTVLKGYMSVLLTKIFREMRKTDAGHILRHANRISPEILKYIEDKCLEKVTLKELAQKCCYNPSYFSRIFKECYGQTLTDYIHEKKLNEAMRLLKETTLSIEAISHRVGYEDKKQFYKIFKKYMGITPSKVRTSIKK